MKNKKFDALLEQINKTKSRSLDYITKRQPEYVDAWEYWLGEQPKAFSLGLAPGSRGESETRTGYVEMVIQEAERKLNASILSIFTDNDSEAVLFRGKGFKRDSKIDDLINTEINHIFLRRNDGYYELEKCIREALITGNGFMKIFVDETIEHDKLPLQQWIRIDDLIAQISQQLDEDGNVFHLDIPPDLFTTKKGKYKGMQWRTRNIVIAADETGQAIKAPVIEVIGNAPLYKTIKEIRPQQVDLKNLIIDTTCGDRFDDCRYICHKREITVGEAIAMGFSEDLLMEASKDDMLTEEALDKRDLMTDKAFTASYSDSDFSSDPHERRITLYESYIYSSLITGKSERLQVLHTKNEILEATKIPSFPFVNARISVIPGSFWGVGLYNMLKDSQDVLSEFSRVAVQKALRSAYPNWFAVKNQYDRQSLLNSSRPGGVVEVSAAGAVSQFMEPQPAPEMFQIMQYVQANAERRTSTSVGSLTDSNGDAPDNLSTQSMSMIVSAEAAKDKIYAKALARTCIRPLFEKIYQCMKAEKLIIHTQEGDVTSDMFPNLYDFEIDIYVQADKLTQAKMLSNALLTVVQVAQAQGAMGVISASNLAQAGKTLLEGSELNADLYFTDPTANIDPAEVQQQKMDEIEDKIIIKNAKRLAYQAQGLANMKTAAEIYAIENKVDEHVITEHSKREIMFNESLIKSQNAQTAAANAMGDAQFKAEQIKSKNKAIDVETILKTAELHQRGSTETDVNGVRV